MLEVVVPLALPGRFAFDAELFQLDAVAKGRIFQLEPRRQHLHQQGVRHRLLARHVESHHHQIADPDLGGIEALPLGSEPAAGHAHPLADALGRLLRVADQGALHIEGALALVGDAGHPQRLGRPQLRAGPAGQGLHAGGRVQPGLPVGGGIGLRQPQQGEPLLGAEPLAVGQHLGQPGAQLGPALGGQPVLAQQGEFEGPVPQRRAVIPQIVIPALDAERLGQRLGGALLIPHGRQGQGEVQQRQAGAGVIRLLLPDEAQGGERCLAHPRQHEGAVGLIGQAAVLGGTAPALAILAVGEVALQATQRLIEHGLRHGLAGLLAGQQVVGGIGGEPLLLVGAAIPQTEAATRQLQPLQTLQQGPLHLGFAQRFLCLGQIL
ncbi:hypothetical protein D3C79_345320 [compost metagenome]